MKKVNVAIVGLGFGKEFIPIYQAHPQAEMYAICQRNRASLDEVGRNFGVERRFTSFEELIADPAVDAVHINSPIHLHAPQAVAALRAGKHVACTVPAATTLEECRQIADAARASGRNYMMMETAIYTREFLFVRELAETGKLGRIQFMRGSHQQEMAGWPGYWEGLPPMHYATHAVSPCLAICAVRLRASHAWAQVESQRSWRRSTVRPSRRRRRTSGCAISLWRLRSLARSSRLRASTSRASMCTATRLPLSGT